MRNKEELFQLLEDDNLEELFSVFKKEARENKRRDVLESLAHLKSDYVRYKKDDQRGLLRSEEAQVKIAHIRQSLIEQINALDDPMTEVKRPIRFSNFTCLLIVGGI